MYVHMYEEQKHHTGRHPKRTHLDDPPELIRDEPRVVARGRVHPLVELPHRLREARVRLLVQVRDRHARGQAGVVRVVDVHVGGRLGGEVVELRGGHLFWVSVLV